MNSGQVELAERLARRRAVVARMAGALLLFSQAGSYHVNAQGRPSLFNLTAWVSWSLIMLAFLFWGSRFGRHRGVRELLNDETTHEHWREAMTHGFWGAIVGALIPYVASFFMPVSAQESVRTVVTLAVAVALLSFGSLEKRALR